MKVPFYILGFLKKEGPLHGYRIKKMIGEQVADFAHIKLPTIYYHLQRMETKNLIVSKQEKEGRRPERLVYTITPMGEETFFRMLNEILEGSYKAEFLFDGGIYFFGLLKDKEILAGSLEKQLNDMAHWLKELSDHRKEIFAFLDGHSKRFAGLLFRHHELHYQAEAAWLKEALSVLKEV